MPAAAGIVAAIVAGLLLAPPLTGQTDESPLHLEVRIFDGPDEVLSGVRLMVYPAGRRDDALAEVATGRVRLPVAPGLYDVAVVRERDERIVGLKWAERLVVMAYPDEAGEHLQVVNLQSGYGALQIRPDPAAPAPPALTAAVYPAGDRSRHAGSPVREEGYLLFVLPAGRYDVSIDTTEGPRWLTGVEVPLDRTRLLLAR